MNAQNVIQNPFERYIERRILDLCANTEMIVVYCLCKHQHEDSGSVAHQWNYKIGFFVRSSLFIVCAKTFLSSEVFSACFRPLFTSVEAPAKYDSLHES